jgi:hypothetical protein
MNVLYLVQKPLYQALLFTGVTLLLFIIIRPQKTETLWTIAGAVYGLFILTNTIALCFEANVWSYFLYSMLFTVLYLLIAGVMVSAFSSMLKAEGSGESSMIFLVIIYHPFLLLLTIFLKWVYFKIF